VLIVANQTLGAVELLTEVQAIHGSTSARFFVCVPDDPPKGGQEGADEFATEIPYAGAYDRLDATLEVLAAEGISAEGALGDYRPLVAVENAVERFQPDSILIVTHPHEHSNWLKQDIVSRLAEQHSVPVHHIISHAPRVHMAP